MSHQLITLAITLFNKGMLKLEKEHACRSYFECSLEVMQSIEVKIKADTMKNLLGLVETRPKVSLPPTPEVSLRAKPQPTKAIMPPLGWKISVNKNKELLRIEDLPLDAKVEIDGIVMLHKDAIGKIFKQGRVIGYDD